MKRKTRYLIDYISYWKQKGDYGEIRIARMRQRKRKRFEAWHQRKQRRGFFYDKHHGCMRQVCEYQPMGSFITTYCDYPCNGDF